MKLLVSLSGSSVNELQFKKGPIYIGRQMGSQVFLPDAAVSRQHAVFYTTREGDWVLEDLGSSNKTYLNSKAIHKNLVNNGDLIRIADFTIKVQLDDEGNGNGHETSYMEDTMVSEGMRPELHTVERKPEASDAPPIKFPGKRAAQFSSAMEMMFETKSLQELYRVLEDIGLEQFSALNVWVSVRKNATGPIEVQGGRKITSEGVQRLELALPSSLAEALEKHRYYLVHQLPRQLSGKGIRSVIIAPILKGKDCFGVIYIENSTEHPHYNLSDMDYLILVSLAAGIKIKQL